MASSSSALPVDIPTLAARGRPAYLNHLRAVAANRDTPRPPIPTPGYNLRPDTAPDAPSVSAATELSLQQSGCPTDNYTFICVENLGSPARGVEPAYQNYVHAGGRALLCMNNFAERDRLRRVGEWLFWSDLLAMYAASCRGTVARAPTSRA
jgi:hypothetical protein